MKQPLDLAIAELRGIADPYNRFREAENLDHALVAARSTVALIKRDAINSLRDSKTGYGTIADMLRLTRGRVQQIANMDPKLGPAAYAFRDDGGDWHGEPNLLQRGAYVDASTPQPFNPTNSENRFAGQTLLVRCGLIPQDGKVSTYGLTVLDSGNPLRVRMTHRVMDELFG